MNLIDAIKSGKPFRRKSWTIQSWTPHPSDLDMSWVFPHRDIIADDWEVQETPVTITRKQFWEAYREAFKASWEPCTLPLHTSAITDLAKRLGLGE